MFAPHSGRDPRGASMIRRMVVLVLAAMLMLPAQPGRAQDAAPATQVEDIIVTARRSGAPMWEITQDDRTLILVGAITPPRELEWRPDALEAATLRADRILFPQQGRASAADVLRLIWRIRTISNLPAGTTTADYLEPEWQARLEAVMAGERSPRWRTTNFVPLSIDLLNDKAGFSRRTSAGPDDVVRRAARRARVPVTPVGIIRGDELIDGLINAPPSTYAPCVKAAIVAAEGGPEMTLARAEAWRRFRVAEVAASPIDAALDVCWPWGDPEVAPLLRGQWDEALNQALTQPGVTLAVAPIRLLARPGGVLDALEARGLQIEGPEWRPITQPTGDAADSGV